MRPRAGRLVVRGGAFLSERSCRSVRRASVLAQPFSGLCGVRSTCFARRAPRRYAAAHLKSLLM